MVEEDFSPLAELISSLIEIRSLVKASCPLNEILFLDFVLGGSELGIVELLFPAFHLAETIYIDKLTSSINKNISYNLELKHLLVRVEESAIRGLELALSWITIETLARLNGLMESSSSGIRNLSSWQVLLGEPKGVDTVWTAEELGLGWISLSVFPSSVRPSAWNQHQVLVHKSS